MRDMTLLREALKNVSMAGGSFEADRGNKQTQNEFEAHIVYLEEALNELERKRELYEGRAKDERQRFFLTIENEGTPYLAVHGSYSKFCIKIAHLSFEESNALAEMIR